MSTLRLLLCAAVYIVISAHSAGLDFETQLYAKPNAAAFWRKNCRPGYVPATMALGTNTDPYQPIEREHRITRSVLEVLQQTGHRLAS